MEERNVSIDTDNSVDILLLLRKGFDNQRAYSDKNGSDNDNIHQLKCCITGVTNENDSKNLYILEMITVRMGQEAET